VGTPGPRKGREVSPLAARAEVRTPSWGKKTPGGEVGLDVWRDEDGEKELEPEGEGEGDASAGGGVELEVDPNLHARRAPRMVWSHSMPVVAKVRARARTPAASSGEASSEAVSSSEDDFDTHSAPVVLHRAQVGRRTVATRASIEMIRGQTSRGQLRSAPPGPMPQSPWTLPVIEPLRIVRRATSQVPLSPAWDSTQVSHSPHRSPTASRRPLPPTPRGDTRPLAVPDLRTIRATRSANALSSPADPAVTPVLESPSRRHGSRSSSFGGAVGGTRAGSPARSSRTRGRVAQSESEEEGSAGASEVWRTPPTSPVISAGPVKGMAREFERRMNFPPGSPRSPRTLRI